MRPKLLYEHLSEQVSACQNIEELKPFLKHVIPFETLKELVLNHLSQTYKKEESETPTPKSPPKLPEKSQATKKELDFSKKE